jgi:hypothetical protein
VERRWPAGVDIRFAGGSTIWWCLLFRFQKTIVMYDFFGFSFSLLNAAAQL